MRKIIMETGLYEQLINHLFRNKLNELDRGNYYIGTQEVTKDNVAKFLSRYLSKIVEQSILSLREEDRDVDRIIEIINDIIKAVGRNFHVEDYVDNLLDAPASILTAVIDCTKNNHPNVAQHIGEIMPITKLTTSTLFTGRNGEINMSSELCREILSSDEICLLVSFIKNSGLRLIMPELEQFVKTGRQLRVITTTYMGATQFKAVADLSKLPNTHVKISYNSDMDRLHAKAYLFLRNTGFHTAYVGSSNLSEPALRDGLEWNVKVTQSESPHIIRHIQNSFETYWNDESFEEFVLGRDDERLRDALRGDNSPKIDYSLLDLMKAKDYQQEVLEKLTAERELHNNYHNLIVAATGTGKTVIAAFDYLRFKEAHPRANLLFVVHREEIIKQARDTFRRVLRNENFGQLWVGKSKPADYSYLFASKDSLNNAIDNLPLSDDYYDYVIIDEAHHITAPTYQKIIQKFKPKILLGLTATPERMDGDDILRYFGNRIPAEIRLTTALNNGLLSPFHYYGVTDNTDLREVRWERGHYVASELSGIYTNSDSRTALIFQKLEEYLDDFRDVKALCFCVSQEHAQYMNAKFTLQGIKSAVLTSENAEDRGRLLGWLKSKRINYLFVVDMFNEGVDIPSIDTVLFLRPTESLTIFLQQFGRGLRKSEGKKFLTVLDFIGQYRAEYNFFDRIKALTGTTPGGVYQEVKNDFNRMPLGCKIKLEPVAKEYVLKNIEDHLKSSGINRIVRAIKTFEDDYSIPLTLTNFLNTYNNIPLSKIYKSSTQSTWATLCQMTGIELTYEITMKKELSFAVYKKWLSTESYSYFSFIRDLAGKSFNVDVAQMSIKEQKMVTMLYYDLYDNAGEYSNLQTFLNYLSKQTLFISEVEQVMTLLMEKCEIVEKDDNSKIKLINPLKLHGRYTKGQIQAAIGTSTIERKSSSREGVERNKEIKMEAMYVDIIKDRDDDSNTNYKDYAMSRSKFHWETQNSVSPSTQAGQNYIKETQTMLLFVREQSTFPDDKSRTMGYLYLGEVKLNEYSGSKPMSIVWDLLTPMPASSLEFAQIYKALG